MEQDLNCSGIYLLRNMVNDKVYVGQSQNIKKRIGEHSRDNRKHTYLCKAIKYYGWNAFEVSILEKIDDPNQFDEREQYWMDTLRAYDRKYGYNLCSKAGTTRGYKYTQEARIKLSQTHLGQIRSPNAGVPIKPIYQLDISTGAIIKAWNSLGEAARELEIRKSGISLCCHDRIKTAGGFVWRFVDKMILDLREWVPPSKVTRPQAVNQLDKLTDTLIKTWSTICDANKELSISSGNITKCCKGQVKTAGGYKWQYV